MGMQNSKVSTADEINGRDNLLSQGKDFCVKRCAAKDDFAEHGDEHIDDLVHAGIGIR